MGPSRRTLVLSVAGSSENTEHDVSVDENQGYDGWIPSFRPRVIGLNHSSDIGTRQLQFGNDRGPKQSVLFFGALDKFVKFVIEFVSGRLGPSA
jgi:hypothetical protein